LDHPSGAFHFIFARVAGFGNVHCNCLGGTAGELRVKAPAWLLYLLVSFYIAAQRPGRQDAEAQQHYPNWG